MILVPIQFKEHGRIHPGHEALLEKARSIDPDYYLFVTLPLEDVRKFLRGEEVDWTSERFSKMRIESHPVKFAELSHHIFHVPEFERYFIKFFPFLSPDSIYLDRAMLMLKARLLGIYHMDLEGEYYEQLRGPEFINIFEHYLDSFRSISTRIYSSVVLNDFGIPYQSNIELVSESHQSLLGGMFRLLSKIILSMPEKLQEMIDRYNQFFETGKYGIRIREWFWVDEKLFWMRGKSFGFLLDTPRTSLNLYGYYPYEEYSLEEVETFLNFIFSGENRDGKFSRSPNSPSL